MSSAQAIEERAARWIVRREDPCWSVDDQRTLDAWLDESLAHKAAFWRLEHGWREADRIGALGKPTAEVPRLTRYAFMRDAHWMKYALVAASVAGTIALGAIGFEWSALHPAVATAQYATALGARKTVPLVDGSRIELNTSSALRAKLGKETREVWLDKGEAYFEIAHIEGRPFVVHAGDRTVTVLGTKFSVRRNGDDVIVSVVQGKVRVDDSQHPDTVPTAIITAGDVAISSGSALLAVRSDEKVKAELAWRDGMIRFDNTTLGEAATQFNRYNRKQIVVTGEAASQIRIGGTFDVSNIDAFARLLHDAYGLQIDVNSEAVKISG